MLFCSELLSAVDLKTVFIKKRKKKEKKKFFFKKRKDPTQGADDGKTPNAALGPGGRSETPGTDPVPPAAPSPPVPQLLPRSVPRWCRGGHDPGLSPPCVRAGGFPLNPCCFSQKEIKLQLQLAACAWSVGEALAPCPSPPLPCWCSSIAVPREPARDTAPAGLATGPSVAPSPKAAPRNISRQVLGCSPQTRDGASWQHGEMWAAGRGAPGKSD